MNPLKISVSNVGRQDLVFSTGSVASQANGSVVVSYADTMVLVTVCASGKVPESQGFFPLTVEYQERRYAMGKIPGGFIKREGRPKDKEILCARLIDRPLRPLFPPDFFNQVQIIAMVLSSDGENDPDILALNGASMAIMMSDIPFYNPVAAVRVSLVDGEMVINPTYAERENSVMDMVVVGTEDKIVMIEGQFSELPEEKIVLALEYAHPFIKRIIEAQKAFQEKEGKTKREFPKKTLPGNLLDLIREIVGKDIEPLFGIDDKVRRSSEIEALIDSAYKKIVEQDGLEVTRDDIVEGFYELEKKVVRDIILKQGRRPDDRALDQVRNIDCEVKVLPRTHGSALFTRGQTQSLASITLGTSSDKQFVETLAGDREKHFMLHYSFPPFSVGETRPLRGLSRREVGHGSLAEKALTGFIPPKEEFPYTIRVVSEILESNGSSSMASVCAASLALMDAGVPIKKALAGIAMGLVKEEQDYKVLTDIAGLEDHYGDMDFKVAGTTDGVTAIQLDMKIDGIDYKIIQDTLDKAKTARLSILEKMNAALPEARKGFSPYAPKIKTVKVDTEKIGEIIGPGGKIIRRIIRENNVDVDIEDETGTVFIVAQDEESLERVAALVLNLVRELQVGDIFEGVVTKIANFGAFCEIVPGKVGLIHISELSDSYVKEVRDFVKEGDRVRVKVIGLEQGRINLSMKQCHEATSPAD